MSVMNDQIAWNVGNDLARNTNDSKPYVAPLFVFHDLLSNAIPVYSFLGPEAQADLVSEAHTGWQDHFSGKGYK